MSEGGPGKANVHAAWRMEVAERAAAAYAPNQRLAVFAVAGSVGPGRSSLLSPGRGVEVDTVVYHLTQLKHGRGMARSQHGIPRG